MTLFHGHLFDALRKRRVFAPNPPLTFQDAYQRHHQLTLPDIAPTTTTPAHSKSSALPTYVQPLKHTDFISSEMFGESPGRDRMAYDMILCNPPYLGTERLDGLTPEVQCEPRMALDGTMRALGESEQTEAALPPGHAEVQPPAKSLRKPSMHPLAVERRHLDTVAADDGLSMIRRIVDEAGEFLTDNGVLLLEVAGHDATLVERTVLQRMASFTWMPSGPDGEDKNVIAIAKVNGVWFQPLSQAKPAAGGAASKHVEKKERDLRSNRWPTSG